MNTGQISDPSLHIQPSEALRDYIAAVKVTRNMPMGIANIVLKNNSNVKAQGEKPADAKYLPTSDDRNYMKTLSVQDLHWLFDYIHRLNDTNESKVYLHELLQGSQVLLPKNVEIPRNTQLEERCQKLKATQQNLEYNQMTKDANVIKKKRLEDTVAYQMKQMNRHLMAVFQLILSAIAGFAFGFVGVELIVENLDLGFRLLLGIVCSLIIALAELYFLAKRLHEDWHFEI